MKTTKLMRRMLRSLNVLADDTNKHGGVVLRNRPYKTAGVEPVGSNAQVQSFYHDKPPKRKLRKQANQQMSSQAWR